MTPAAENTLPSHRCLEKKRKPSAFASPIKPLKQWSNPEYAFPQISTLSFYFLNTKYLPSLFSFWLNTIHRLRLCSSITSWLEDFSDCPTASSQYVRHASLWPHLCVHSMEFPCWLVYLAHCAGSLWRQKLSHFWAMILQIIFICFFFLSACFPSPSFNYINKACGKRLKQYRSIE